MSFKSIAANFFGWIGKAGEMSDDTRRLVGRRRIEEVCVSLPADCSQGKRGRNRVVIRWIFLLLPFTWLICLRKFYFSPSGVSFLLCKEFVFFLTASYASYSLLCVFLLSSSFFQFLSLATNATGGSGAFNIPAKQAQNKRERVV